MEFPPLLSLNDVFYSLSNHLEFVPFITIYSINQTSRTVLSKQELQPYEIQRFEILGRLSNFYNFNLIGKPIVFPKTSSDFSSLSGYHRRIYHSLLAIEKRINEENVKNQKDKIKFLQRFMDFIVSFPNNLTDIILKVDEVSLYKYLKEESQNVISMKAFHSFRLQLLNRVVSSLSTPESVRFELKRMIEIMSLTIDPSTSYFPQHPLQISFERVLMSPMLPYAKDINELIADFPDSDPQMFVNSIFDEVVVILRDLQFSEKRHDMALVLLLYRLVFDRVYSQNSQLNKSCPDLISSLRSVQLNELPIPREYSPPMDETKTCVDVFRKDPFFAKAIDHLENVMYYINPFDILSCVYQSIQQIEKAATIYSRDTPPSVFAFEVTFGLFIGVLLGSQIKTWKSVVNFVMSYTPQTGLAAQFEYARAKMEASTAECERMIQDIESKETEIQAKNLILGVSNPLNNMVAC